MTRSVALGDVDGDGDLDLVCGNEQQSNTLFENTGGTFSNTPIWSSGPTNATRSVALGDVDGDGDLDLVCGNDSFDSNTIYENTSGMFASTPIWSSGLTSETVSVALGDVDGDGDLDLVCGNDNRSNTLYENSGGTFASTPIWSSGPTNLTQSVALGDVDGDGDLDLVCGNYWDQNNTLYENIGGTFSSTPIWLSSLAYWTTSVTLGDVDRDGDLDLVCGNEDGRSNTLYENRGGTFSSTSVWFSGPGNSTESVALGDVDGDGDLDLVCGNEHRSNTLYENISGTFASTPIWSSGPMNETNSIALGDVDRDGDLDLVCADGSDNTLYENISGTFASAPIWSSSAQSDAVALGDVDGDGDLDLVSGCSGYENTLFENIGGTFSSIPIWSSGPVNKTNSIALGDVDGDGDLDLVCGNDWDQNNTLYENIGGTFSSTPIWSSGPMNNTNSIALGDVDGDGDLDLVCGNRGEENTLYENTDSMFAFTPIWSSGLTSETVSVALGDVDGDGDLDLVCGNYNQSNTLYENIGGTFSSTSVWFSGPTNSTFSVALGDVDGDGDLDLVCGNILQSNTLYENIGGTFSSTSVWFSGPTSGTVGVALGDVDKDGDLDLVCGNYRESDMLYKNTKNPAYRGDLLVPTHQIPNNGPFIGQSSVDMTDTNNYQVTFTVYDVESDMVWIVPEYKFVSESQWRPVYQVGGGVSFGPIAAAPEGVTDSLEWDITLLPFDHRDVVLRLRAVEIPVRVSTIQHASSYLQNIDHIVPIRPELSSSVDSLLFSQTAITVGDTTSRELILSNTGTLDLQVTQITLPSTEMRIDRTTPFILQPGQADTVTVFLEPRIETDIDGRITITSDDPVTPSRSIHVSSDIRTLDVTNKLLKESDVIPLGEAVTVVVTPAPQVNVERGHLYFRAAGASAFLDSIALSTFENEFVVVIPGEKVTEVGLEYYIKVENSGLFGTDPSTAPDSFYSQAVEFPAGMTTEPIPNSGSDFLSDREIKIYAILPTGSRFQSGAIHYRQGGSDGFMVDSLVLEDVFPEASIPDSAVGERGVEYWVDVNTETAHLYDPPVEPSLYPQTITVIVQDLVEPRVHVGGEEASAYRMISVPLAFKEDFTGTIEALLSDQPAFGPYDPVKWRSWVYLSESDTYGELSDQSLAPHFRPQPGRAFWLISRENHQITTAPVSGLSTPTEAPYALELKSGWNMVGSPFAFPVSWNSVLVDTLSMGEAEGVSVDPPIGWNRKYIRDVTTMEPFDGYWIYNRTDHPVTLYVPPKETIAGPSPAPLAVAGRGEDFWLSLRVTSGDQEQTFASIGTSPQAVPGLDRFDRLKPPPAPEQGISLYFLTQGAGERYHRLSEDIRPNTTSSGEWGEIWAFDVKKSFSNEPAGDEVTISIDSFVNLPTDASIVLIDRTFDRQVALNDGVEYTFYLETRDYVATEENTRFRIIVGTETFVQEEASRLLNLPTQSALYQNYPNPFNPSTVIRYDIAEPGMVNLCIYSVTGALVKVLETRHRDRGRYDVGWNGENNRGEQISSGVYFYRLTAPGYSQTRKMVLVR